MVIKSPAASAMRAKESSETYASPGSIRNSRVVRLGGFRGTATDIRDTKVKESAGVRMVYKPAVKASPQTESMPVAKPALKAVLKTGVKPVAFRGADLKAKTVAKPAVQSVAKPIAKPVSQSAANRVAPPRKAPSSTPFERPYKEGPSKKSFYQKRGEAFPTTRIGAKLSAIQAEFLPQVSFWKVLALSLAAGAFGIAYIHHGFEMQEQLNRVEALELQVERTRRVFTEKQIRYDRLTGPKEIYQKAQEAGFVSAGPAKQSIPVRIDTP